MDRWKDGWKVIQYPPSSTSLRRGTNTPEPIRPHIHKYSNPLHDGIQGSEVKFSTSWTGRRGIWSAPKCWACAVKTSCWACAVETSCWACAVKTSCWACTVRTSCWACAVKTSCWACAVKTSCWACAVKTSRWACTVRTYLSLPTVPESLCVGEPVAEPLSVCSEDFPVLWNARNSASNWRNLSL